MPTPRHRQRAVSRRRRIQRLALAALALTTLAVASAVDRDDGVGTQLAATRPEAAVSTTTATATTTATSSTAAPTTAIAVTTTTPPPAPSATYTWYAVVHSAVKDGTDRDALRGEVADYGEQGRVIDTDDYRTGDGGPPDHLPAPGLLAAVVGPFASHHEVEAWCAGYDGDQGCQYRQLLPR